MKKTLVIIAIAFGFTATSLNATNVEHLETPNLENAIIEGKVNAFCLSIVKGDIETVQKLISLGADVNQKSNGMAPLHYAAKYNKTKIAKLLVKHGAKLNARCDRGYTALKYAKLSNAKDVYALLEELKQNAKRRRKA